MDTSRYIYALHVAQQPQRARMCGFGDKDRRPITPPPCVRLSITDRATMKEIDVSMLDISFFVLTVDLWDENAQNELNLVVHPSSSSQSSTIALGGPSGDASGPASGTQWSERPPDSQQAFHGQSGHMTMPPSAAEGKMAADSERASHQRQDGEMRGQQPASDPQVTQARRTSTTQHHPGSFTRNLIGSLVASAFKLNDMQDELGIWFVLQDLSVRTEGTFRLKFNFVDLSTGTQSLLTSGSAPVLCSGFSNPFSVFSAKRFPGMIESTDISRKFSNQGIKIPVRKAEN